MRHAETVKTHPPWYEETFTKCVAGCLKCGVSKAASRTVKKGEALLGVITFDNLVSAVAHVAAQGLPGICADPRPPEQRRGPERAAKTPGGYTKTNIPVAIALQERASRGVWRCVKWRGVLRCCGSSFIGTL